MQADGIADDADPVFNKDLVIRARQRVGVDGCHVRLERVLDALDLGGQLVGHAAQLAQLVDLALNFCVAHW